MTGRCVGRQALFLQFEISLIFSHWLLSRPRHRICQPRSLNAWKMFTTFTRLWGTQLLLTEEYTGPHLYRSARAFRESCETRRHFGLICREPQHRKSNLSQIIAWNNIARLNLIDFTLEGMFLWTMKSQAGSVGTQGWGEEGTKKIRGIALSIFIITNQG